MPPQVWRLSQTPAQVLDQTLVTTVPLINADYNYIDLDSFALLLMIDTDTF